jgi:hypothetical protein
VTGRPDLLDGATRRGRESGRAQGGEVALRSVPHIVVKVILTIASVGAVRPGLGRSCKSFRGFLVRAEINESFHRFCLFVAIETSIARCA